MDGGLVPLVIHRADGCTQADGRDLDLVASDPQRHDEPGQNHDSHTQNPNGVTHAASLPPDLEDVLIRQRYNEDQGATEREVGYRKGWNDHARHMLRMLAAREAL